MYDDLNIKSGLDYNIQYKYVQYMNITLQTVNNNVYNNDAND